MRQPCAVTVARRGFAIPSRSRCWRRGPPPATARPARVASIRIASRVTSRVTSRVVNDGRQAATAGYKFQDAGQQQTFTHLAGWLGWRLLSAAPRHGRCGGMPAALRVVPALPLRVDRPRASETLLRLVLGLPVRQAAPRRAGRARRRRRRGRAPAHDVCAAGGATSRPSVCTPA